MTSPALTLTAALLVALSSAAPARAQASAAEEGCAGAIERWQAFAAQENQGGHMDTPVFEAIQADIARATASCQAGHEAEALRLVTASKRRHGY